MAKKKDSFFDTLLKIGAVVGGAMIAAEIIDSLSEKKTYYNCPNCNHNRIEYGEEECPNCGTTLNWDDTIEDEDGDCDD